MGVDVAYLVVVVFVVAVYVVVAAIGNLRQLELTFKLGCGCVFFYSWCCCCRRCCLMLSVFVDLYFIYLFAFCSLVVGA